MSKKLINKSAAILEDRGYTQITSAQDRQRQSGGVTHTVFRHDASNEKLFVRAKDYCYQDCVPFGKGMVQHAASEGVRMVCYFDDTERYVVADPDYVERHGDQRTGRSKWETDENRVYLEVTMADCCGLDEYVTGTSSPRELSRRETDTTRPTGLDDYL